MTKRPTAVTVFGWFWVVGGILGMAFAWPLAYRGSEWFGDLSPGLFWRLPPLPIFLYGFFASLVGLICGNGLLKGRNWARGLAVGYCLVAMLIGFPFFEKTPLFWMNLIWNLAFTAIMWYLLYRPVCNGYFTEAGGLEPQGTAL